MQIQENTNAENATKYKHAQHSDANEGNSITGFLKQQSDKVQISQNANIQHDEITKCMY